MKRIAIFEGLRGWLSCWVMVSHIMLYCAISSADVKSPFWRYLVHLPESGRTPVWLFMILSGFVNFYLLDVRREKIHVYLTRRFLRLYPVLALLFVASLPITWMNLHTLHSISWADNTWIHIQYLVTQSAFQYFVPNVIAHATLLGGWVPSTSWPHTTSSFLGVDWSVSAEWQFYLLMPLLFAWAGKKWGLVGIAALACLCFFSFTNKRIELFENDNPSLLVFKFHYFFIGIASYLFYRQWVLHKPAAGLGLAQMLLVAFFILYLAGWEYAVVLWGAIFLLTIVAETHPTDRIVTRLSWIFANRWSQYLGRISYSIYLSHWLSLMLVLRAIIFFDPKISSAHAALWMFPGVIALTLTLSPFLYLWVEEPCIRFGKRLFHEE